ncbi:hypothetical protein ACN9MJ_13020 [Acidovorax facilis]|uniref:hypothetical protein n=1 Tax=Acidovorax facilis TaxID=12917 RepID=UPI003CF8D4EA
MTRTNTPRGFGRWTYCVFAAIASIILSLTFQAHAVSTGAELGLESDQTGKNTTSKFPENIPLKRETDQPQNAPGFAIQALLLAVIGAGGVFAWWVKKNHQNTRSNMLAPRGNWLSLLQIARPQNPSDQTVPQILHRTRIDRYTQLLVIEWHTQQYLVTVSAEGQAFLVATHAAEQSAKAGVS